MKRSLIACAIALPLAALTVSPVWADAKTRDKTQIKFEGMLGRVVGMFGGRAARDGIVATTAVKGNRKSSIGDSSGRIVDLGEEKVYDLDVKKKEYRVTTFEEMRRQMKEAQEKAQKEAAREQEREEEKPDPSKPQKELEVDFDVKETGQRKQLAGYDTREVIMTVTVREKGKVLEESGGFVMASTLWLGPELPQVKELTAFEVRFLKQVYGEQMYGMAAEQSAMVMAMYPMLKKASERLKQEEAKLKGSPIATTTTFEAVKSKAQMEAGDSQGNSGGGLGGMLARKMMKKGDPKPRTTILTMQHEFLEISNTVAPADLEIPAGYKEKK